MVKNREGKRALNISRASLHARPNEPQHKECTHYLFDLDETGDADEPIGST